MSATEVPRLTPVKAVAAYCLDACPRTRKYVAMHDDDWWFAVHAVHACRQRTCPLRPYREGRHPGRAGIGGRPRRLAKTGGT